jgi:tetratricopeptide (TPR) repeat protein
MVAKSGWKNTRAWLLIIFAMAILFSGCAPNLHQSALQQYRGGNPALAEETLTPWLAEKADDKDAMLYLWDIGMFRFAQGNYLAATEVWMKSDIMAGIEPGSGETFSALMSADANKDYLGDPVEHSLASLYVGLGYYMVGDYQNALVAFKKSLEWDFNKEPELTGNMVITNHMMGECYTQLGNSDDAVVGYRRAIKESPDFVPSYVGAIRELEKMNNMDEAARMREELAALVPEAYMQTMDQHPQGILTVIMSDYPPPIEAVGDAFRKRKDTKSRIHSWVVASEQLYSREPGAKLDFFTADSALHASLADHTLTHFKDQGGETGQVARKLIQTGISAVTESLFGFGTDSSADMRYWSTIPGDVFAMYLPLEPGLHTVRAFAYNKDHAGMHDYKQLWHYIPVREEQTTALVLISHDKMFDPNKVDKAPPPLACCDATGHDPENIPFILGGDCFCTPSRRLVEAMHAAGYHTDVDYAALKKLYDNADIVTSQDHRGCNNLCSGGPHVAFGGKCMSNPTPGTRNYESVLLWRRGSGETIEMGEAETDDQSGDNESSQAEVQSDTGETQIENE